MTLFEAGRPKPEGWVGGGEGGGFEPQRAQPVEAQEVSSKGPRSEGRGHSIRVTMNHGTPPVMMSRLYNSIIRHDNCFHGPAWN